jgi:[ribosomal protein S5]-alanine N-acetyltransferase
VQEPIFTDRLELRPGSAAAYAVAPDDGKGLAGVLEIVVPAEWPVENYDEEALQFSLRALEAGEEPPMRYVIERGTNTLVGVVGGGSPKDGTLVTGYAVLPQYQRRGYATEAVEGLIRWAFGRADVDRIIADTYPKLVASIRVLEKTGFRHVGPGDGERVIRYELRR